MKRSAKPFRQMQGVDALFGDDAVEKEVSSQQTLPLSQIKLSASQPRRYFEPEKIEQLAQSIQAHGVLEPLLVRLVRDGKYEVVAGERRYRAAQLINLTEVPVIIRELDDREALQVALIENLQREDLNPVEETEGILQLLSLQLGGASREEITSLLYRMRNEVQGKTSTHNVMLETQETVKAVFQRVGIAWESFVVNRLSLLNLPAEILESLRQGKIAYTKAVAISKVKDERQRQWLLEEAISENLSLAEIKNRIAALTVAPELDQPLTLKQQFESTYRQAKKSKVWDNPKKQKNLERLLNEFQSLIEGEA